MASAKVRLTWPCGMQKSWEAAGLLVLPQTNEEKAHPCPLHGVHCPPNRGVAK